MFSASEVSSPPSTTIARSGTPDLFLGINVTLAGSYRDAAASVLHRFQKEEAHDLLGYERRAYVEDGWRGLGERFRLRCPAVANSAKNWHHRELRFGSIVLTESYSDDHTVRPALHRQELAEVNGSIFGLQFEEPEKPGLIYGIVVHGAHPKDRARLGYVKVHFPLVDRDRYKTTVDLLSAFPLPTVNEEKIASDAAITPKKTQKDLEN